MNTNINDPLVSIVAICYNHERYVIETLDSILEQTYKNIQLIIIDDCSTDNSVFIIKEWIKSNNAKCTFITHKENKGLCKTLNEALKLSNGDYFQSISCDDILLPDKIEKQVKIFSNSDDETGVVYSDGIVVDKNGEILHISFNKKKGLTKNELRSGFIFDQLIQRCIILAPSVLIKMGVFKVIGTYDENLSYEDWDIFLRIALKFKFKHMTNQTVKYRYLSTSMSNTKGIDYYESTMKSHSKFLSINGESDKIIKKRINKLSKTIYRLNSANSSYWLWKNFILNKNVKTFMLYIFSVLGIRQSFLSSIISYIKAFNISNKVAEFSTHLLC